MRTMLALAAVLTIAVPLSIAPSSVSAHTPEDEQACTPDVIRLCMQAVPDESRIVACLGQNKQLLSPACFKVLDRGRSASVQKTKS